jgi:muconolactone delta-isomerase
MNEKKLYIVEFDILYPDDMEFMDLIPKQRSLINQYFVDGKLLNYSLNKERTRLWAIFKTDTEIELISLIDTLPLTRFMDYSYEELLFNNSISMIPTISLN